MVHPQTWWTTAALIGATAVLACCGPVSEEDWLQVPLHDLRPSHLMVRHELCEGRPCRPDEVEVSVWFSTRTELPEREGLCLEIDLEAVRLGGQNMRLVDGEVVTPAGVDCAPMRAVTTMNSSELWQPGESVELEVVLEAQDGWLETWSGIVRSEEPHLVRVGELDAYRRFLPDRLGRVYRNGELGITFDRRIGASQSVTFALRHQPEVANTSPVTHTQDEAYRASTIAASPRDTDLTSVRLEGQLMPGTWSVDLEMFALDPERPEAFCQTLTGECVPSTGVYVRSSSSVEVEGWPVPPPIRRSRSSGIFD